MASIHPEKHLNATIEAVALRKAQISLTMNGLAAMDPGWGCRHSLLGDS